MKAGTLVFWTPADREKAADTRACTCHPDEAPIPCQHRYAFSECMATRVVELEAALAAAEAESLQGGKEIVNLRIELEASEADRGNAIKLAASQARRAEASEASATALLEAVETCGAYAFNLSGSPRAKEAAVTRIHEVVRAAILKHGTPQ